MSRFGVIVAAALLGACGDQADTDASPGATGEEGLPASQTTDARIEKTAGWDLQSSGEGTALALLSASGAVAIRLFCSARENRLLVNVPGFKPIGSEERLSLGSGGEIVSLVADVRGDAQRGGVSGTGEVPRNLLSLVGGPVSVNYGAQNSGPHPAPPQEAARAFATACQEAAGVGGQGPSGSVSPCLMQGGERLQVKPLRAVGTEPFWAARVEGRCVTYSHPEDQQGTRVWSRFTQGPNGGGTWTGALHGSRFELRVRPEPGCSDGMSDKRYPFAVELAVLGEQRRGCAEPLASNPAP